MAADRTNTDMLILEFLSVTKPSRRREVKERLDALTKYDCSEFRHDSASRSSPFTIYCRRYVTVHVPSFCNI